MQKRHLTFQAIGTKWTIDASTDVVDSSWHKIEQSIQKTIDEFDKVYSRFRDDSLITKMSKLAGTYAVPDNALKLLAFYEKLYTATEGKVTPLIGQVMSDAGYDANYSLQPKGLHQPPDWNDVISYDKNKLTLAQPALLDFGAAGKGYLVDIVAQILLSAHITNYYVNAGGDIAYSTDEKIPLRVGLENPQDQTQVVGIATIENQSLCASSGSKRNWGPYHHIIDPSRLESPKDIVAIWVVAADTMTADGIATALFFTSASKLQNNFEFSYALLRSDMSLEYSRDFPAKIFKEEE